MGAIYAFSFSMPRKIPSTLSNKQGTVWIYIYIYIMRSPQSRLIPLLFGNSERTSRSILSLFFTSNPNRWNWLQKNPYAFPPACPQHRSATSKGGRNSMSQAWDGLVHCVWCRWVVWREVTRSFHGIAASRQRFVGRLVWGLFKKKPLFWEPSILYPFLR